MEEDTRQTERSQQNSDNTVNEVHTLSSDHPMSNGVQSGDISHGNDNNVGVANDGMGKHGREGDSGVGASYTGSSSHKNKFKQKHSKQSLMEYFNLKKSGKISPMTANQSPSIGSATRRSAWERAQDQYELESRQKQRKRKDIQLEDVDVLQNETWFDQRSLKHVFRTKRFKNPKLEALYQRYFFKLNQYNLSIMVALLSVISILMIICYYISGGIFPVRGVCLGFIILLFVFIEILCNRSSFDQHQAQLVCYGIIVIQMGFIAVITSDTTPRTASDNMWCVVMAVYLTYTLLPVRMRIAVLSANLTILIHIVITVARNYQDSFLWKQVCVMMYEGYSINLWNFAINKSTLNISF